MNIRSLLLSLLFLAAGPAAVSTLEAAPGHPDIQPDPKLTLPVPVSTVSPTLVPRLYADCTVQVEMTIDANGVPHQVEPGPGVAPDLARRLLPAVSQWRFAPAQQDGRPVPLHVILPVKLACHD